MGAARPSVGLSGFIEGARPAFGFIAVRIVSPILALIVKLFGDYWVFFFVVFLAVVVEAQIVVTLDAVVVAVFAFVLVV